MAGINTFTIDNITFNCNLNNDIYYIDTTYEDFKYGGSVSCDVLFQDIHKLLNNSDTIANVEITDGLISITIENFFLELINIKLHKFIISGNYISTSLLYLQMRS